MLPIVIEPGTFKRDFLGGNGTLNLDWAGFDATKSFPLSLTTVQSGSVTGSTGDLSFGQSNGLQMTASLSATGSSTIEIVRDATKSDFAKQYELTVPAGKIGCRFHLEGQAGGTISGSVPLPAMANLDFGIEAGASVFYDRFCLYDAKKPSGDVLIDLITGLRLPEHAGSSASIPGPGELLVFGYDGYLDMNAGLSWGYQLIGHQGIAYNDLNASIDYALRLKAAVNLGYKLAGNFEISARAGSNPGSVRLTVKKSRSHEFDAAVGFQANAQAQVNELPSSADEFLSALLGADAKQALALFQKVRSYTDLNKLEADTDKILLGSVKNLANKWLGEALDATNVTQFLTIAGKVVDDYNSIDDRVIAAVTHLYEDYVDQNAIDTLKSALTKIVSLSRRDDLANLSDSEAWKVISTLVGGDLAQLTQDNATFAEIITIAQKTLDFLNGGWQTRLRDLIDELKSQFHLDQVFGTLDKYDSKAKLLTLADTKLQGVVEKLLGQAWDQIKSSGATKAAKDLQKALDAVDAFKNNWYAKITSALNQSFGLSVNYAYTTTSSNDTLIDVEIDVSTARGQNLFNAAIHGQFSTVFDNSNLSLLRINRGVLTHQLTKSSQLQINVFNWESKRIVDVLSQTVNSVEVQPTGLVNVFTTTASIKERTSTKSYSMESNFVMNLVGEAARPSAGATPQELAQGKYLVATVRKFGVTYNLGVTRNLTSASQLTHLLDLAQHVRLIDDAAATAATLDAQFSKGLGTVTATYVVNFDGDGILDAFQAEQGAALQAIVRDTCRRLVSAHLIGTADDGDMQNIGFAYRLGIDYTTLVQDGFAAFLSSNATFQLPSWAPGGQKQVSFLANSSIRQNLLNLYQVEIATATRLDKLDATVDKARTQSVPVQESELEDAARVFVQEAAPLNAWGCENTFFGVFDAFIEIGSNGKTHRESTLILQITPPGATSPITKYLMTP